MKLFIVFILLNGKLSTSFIVQLLIFLFLSAVIINIASARSLQELYEDMELKMFDFRQKDFKPIEPIPAFVEKTPPPIEMPKKNPGFGKLARGKFVPIQPVASLAQQADLISKPKTVSTILNRIRAGRLFF